MSSDKKIEEFPDKIYPLNFAGYIRFFDEPYYEARDLLDADVVGMNNAERLGDEIARRYSEVAELRKKYDEVSEKFHQMNSSRFLYTEAYKQIETKNQELRKQLEDSRELSQANAMRGLNYRAAYEETKRQAEALAEVLENVITDAHLNERVPNEWIDKAETVLDNYKQNQYKRQ